MHPAFRRRLRTGIGEGLDLGRFEPECLAEPLRHRLALGGEAVFAGLKRIAGAGFHRWRLGTVAHRREGAPAFDLARLRKTEKRRVGKERVSKCRSRWWRIHEKQKTNEHKRRTEKRLAK